MAQTPLFTDGEAGPEYSNIKAAETSYAASARSFCEELWETYAPYADPDFLTEIRHKFNDRFWEMYLTVSLHSAGFDIECPKPGPDVGILHEGKRIWFEAVCPTRGQDGHPDQVPVAPPGSAWTAPNEKMLLRYLNAISYKCRTQYHSWIEARTIAATDCFVVAIYPRQLEYLSLRSYGQ